MNTLYYGDNLDILRRFIRDETVDLCYIDPPFNSKRNYNQIYNNIGTEDRAQAQAFVDTWSWWGDLDGAERKDSLAEQALDDILTNKNGVQTTQSIALTEGLLKVLGRGSLMAYLVAMTVRIAEIHRVLKKTGSFYMHCDDVADSYLRLICDAIFIPQGGDFKNEIVWKRTSAHSDSGRYGRNTDRIHYFTKSINDFTYNQQYQPYNDDYKARFRNEDADGRKWSDYDLSAKGLSGGGYTYEYKGVTSLWRCPLETMKKYDEEKRLHFTSKGGIRFKRYLDDLPGIPAQGLWDDINPINSQAREKLGYPTQKPEALLERIISASSNEGDTVLDAFCGCGTTIAVADRLKRSWIGMDITYQSVSLILKRLKDHRSDKTLSDVELHGVPKDMESVDALINKRDDRVRKEFEKWAVLTYSDNRAIINDKKGADRGIDGIAYMRTGKDSTEKLLFSVKSGNIGRAHVAELRGTIEREGAAAGILIMRNDPTRPMIEEAREAGKFKPEYAAEFDRLQIVTVRQMLDGARLNLPLIEEVAKKAQRAKADDEQPNMLGE